MTLTVQQTDLIGPGTQFSFAASNDDLLLLEGVSIVSTDSGAISGDFGDHNVQINGHVGSGGVSNTISLIGGNDYVSIGLTGSVSSFTFAGNTAIFLAGGDSVLENNGEISAGEAVGVLSAGGSNSIMNRGTIHGGYNGVMLGLSNSSNDSLVNHGSISGGGTGDTIRTGHGVFTEGDNTTIVNHGSISGFEENGSGVSIGDNPFNGGDGSSVENHGSITSAQYYGVDFFNMLAGDRAVLTNYGTISGAAGSFRGNETTDSVINQGIMHGNVALDDGEDTFDGRGGSVTGTVLGGAGDDTIYGGSVNDMLRGGGGGDFLAGGGGTDTATYAGSNAGVTVKLWNNTAEGGHAGGDGLSSIENLFGSNFGDVLVGTSSANSLNGSGGNDSLNGGAGADRINGGTGTDTVTYSGSNAGVSVRLWNNTASGGHAEGDRLKNIENVTGSNSGDLLAGDSAANKLNGLGGNDVINSGRGNDILSGGTGNDVFEFGNSFGDNTILDFSSNNAEDIDLSAVSNITSFTDLVNNHLNNNAGTAEIFDGGNTILLQGVAFANVGAGQLYSADDFVF